MKTLKDEIKQLEYQPLNSKVIEALGIKVVNWLDLIKYQRIEDILPCILFIPIESQMEGHYVALFLQNGILNYWCSYGYNIPFTIKKSFYLQETQIDDEDYLNNLIKDFLNRGNKMIINNHRFQKLNNSATCGRFSIIRISKKHLSNDVFMKWFKFDNISNDELICLLTFLLG